MSERERWREGGKRRIKTDVCGGVEIDVTLKMRRSLEARGRPSMKLRALSQDYRAPDLGVP